jgi:hypothetical protein
VRGHANAYNRGAMRRNLPVREYIRLPASIWLGLVAAIAYCSWPLGYWLNPYVGAHGLASELEAVHQPYNWLFVLLDVATALLTVVVAVLLGRLAMLRRYRLLRLSMYSYAAFGILAGLGAVLPMHCDPSIHACGSIWHDPLLIVHGITSIMSVSFLFVSLLLAAYFIRRNHPKTEFLVALLTMLGMWGLFGIGAVIEIMDRDKGNGLQHFFITICSLTLVVMPAIFERYDTHARRVKL